MITISQVKAARALLEWTQKGLATRSGLSLATIAALEQNKGSPKPSTWKIVRTTFEHAGIEFTAEPGVRIQREKFDVQILEGYESAITIWRDIESQLASTHGEVLISGVDERIWINKYGSDFSYTLKHRKKLGITSRILISEGDALLTDKPGFYRTIPEYLFQQTPYFVYADKIAIVNWTPPQRILLVRNPLMAETFRKQFEFNWKIGKELDPSKVAIASLPD